MERKAYPSDVTDDAWAFVAPYLTLMTEEAPSLREVFNGLRWIARAAPFRHLARDDERLPETLRDLHFLVFAIRMLTRFVALMVQSA